MSAVMTPHQHSAGFPFKSDSTQLSMIVATIYSVRPSSKEMRDMSPHSVINP